jgi:pyruvate dehydrogenase E2 component (dihydrolipoamide acetyltransferase)
MPDFLLPDLGEGLTEAEIISWLVDVGDEVRTDQPVVEVETAKAVVEVPVPFAGTVTALHGRPGQVLAVGRPLITVGAETVVADAQTAGGLREPGMVNGRRAADGTSGNVLIGYGTPTAAAVRRRRRRATVAHGMDSVATSPASADASSADGAASTAAVISPPVRLLAKRAGLDLSTITGTGPRGIIRRADVQAAIASASRPSSPAAPATAGGHGGARGNDDHAADRRIPMTPTRRYIADKMSRSRQEIPEATVWVDVDATDLLAARAEINRRGSDRPVSVLALLSRLVVLGLRRYPELGGRIDGTDIVLPAHVHLGFAAQTDRGLVVPVIRDAERMTSRELSAAIAGLTDAARAGTLTPQDMSGGTFSINNYGVFGVDGSAAIINQPEVAMLGLGRIIDRPWVVDGQVVPRKMAQLSLVFDHRICDGGAAGGFLRFVADCVEFPLGALADL